MCIRDGGGDYVITFQDEIYTDLYHHNDDIFSIQQRFRREVRIGRTQNGGRDNTGSGYRCRRRQGYHRTRRAGTFLGLVSPAAERDRISWGGLCIS